MQRMLGLRAEMTEYETAEDALSRLNRELRAIVSCHHTLIRAVDEPTLLAEICRIVCEEAGYRMAWVGYVEHDADKTVRPVARAGHDSGYVDQAAITWADVPRGRGPGGMAIRGGASFWVQDYANDRRVALWRAEALARGYRAAVALPLKDERGEVFGVFCLYTGETNVFTVEEIRLLEELVADLAFGVHVLRQREERKAIHARLRENLHFFESMERVNQAIQEENDVETMAGRVLDATLTMFGCDRSWLVYPCDPQSAGWSAPIVRARPAHAIPLGSDRAVETAPEDRATLAALLAASGPVAFGPGAEGDLSETIGARFGVQSQLAMAIHPKTAKPYAFGLHQCSHARVWSEHDKRLFEAIGRRLEDALTSLHAHHELSERESQLRALVQTIPDVIWVKDIEGRYTRCNPPFERALGRAASDVVGKLDGDLWPREVAERYRLGDRLAIETGAVYSAEFETALPDGQTNRFEVLKAPLRDESGRTTGVIGVARDISERRRVEQHLRIAAAAFEAQEAIVIVGADRKVLRVNRAYVDMTGLSADEVVGKTMAETAANATAAQRIAEIADAVARDGAWKGEISGHRKSGEVFPAWVTVARVIGDRGETTHYVVTMTDIGERRRAEREIETLAYYDRLTGLPNRRLFLDRLQQALVDSLRSGRKGALLFIDLDNFKLLNETSGHEAGDQLLIEVARRLAANVGGAAARVGGDEFVALLENLGDDLREAATQAKQTGETILAALGAPYALGCGVAHSSPSIGVVVFGEGATTSDELLKQADIAMYEAKAAGRNALRFFDPEMQAALAARAEAEAALRLAIREERFVLHYQPQVDFNGEWIGAEALVRWAHPERGLVGPCEFIPLAEETGLIIAIGRWVLRSACQRLRAWAGDSRRRDLNLSVNVSAKQFGRPDFVAEIDQALSASGAPAERLVLELTESVVLDDVDGAIDKMNALKALGVGIALDDFGTGYSSLAYLARLPLDQIKIDRCFVRNLPTSANDAAVAHTIITLAESLGLGVVAEGVETEGQRQFLEQHGCAAFQGFLFAKPMPLDQFEARLA